MCFFACPGEAQESSTRGGLSVSRTRIHGGSSSKPDDERQWPMAMGRWGGASTSVVFRPHALPAPPIKIRLYQKYPILQAMPACAPASKTGICTSPACSTFDSSVDIPLAFYTFPAFPSVAAYTCRVGLIVRSSQGYPLSRRSGIICVSLDVLAWTITLTFFPLLFFLRSPSASSLFVFNILPPSVSCLSLTPVNSSVA